jgi:hypothetical protein
MPFKFNASEAGLKRRGDLTLWIGEAPLDKGQAPRRDTPGGQATTYSDLAIEMVLYCGQCSTPPCVRLRDSTAACFPCWVSISKFLITPRSADVVVSHHAAARSGRALSTSGCRRHGTETNWTRRVEEVRSGRHRRYWRKLHLAVDAGRR